MFCSELGAKYDTMEFFTLVWVSFILPAFEGATVLTFVRVLSLLAVPLSKIKIMRGKVSTMAGVKARMLSQMEPDTRLSAREESSTVKVQSSSSSKSVHKK